MKKKIKSNKGFTLIELIIAVAIIVAVVMPMASVFIKAATQNGKAKYKNNANVVAKNIMEYYKNTPVEEIYATTLAEAEDSMVVSDSDGDGINDTFTFDAYEKDNEGNIRVTDGHYYIRGASGEKYFVTVNISPEGYKEDTYTADDGSIKTKTLINSYESPRLTDLYNGNNIVITDELSKYDSYAASQLGTTSDNVAKKSRIRVETTIYKETGESAFRYKTTVYAIGEYSTPGKLPYTFKSVVATKRFEASDSIPDIYVLFSPYNSTGTVSSDVLQVVNVYYLDTGATVDLAEKQIPKIHVVDANRNLSADAITISSITGMAYYAPVSNKESIVYLDNLKYLQVYSSIDALGLKDITADGKKTNSLYTIDITVRQKKYDGEIVAKISSAKEASYESQIK